MAHRIVSYCSKNYSDALEYIVPSWVQNSQPDEVIVYTDWEPDVEIDNVTFIKAYDISDSWVENVGRKADSICRYLAEYDDLDIAFIESDCYVVRDFSHLFDKDFDIAVTRFHSKEKYTCGTITCGLWFAHVNKRVRNLITQWRKLQKAYFMAGKGIRKGMIAYDQYSFTDLVRNKYASGEVKILPVDEKVYNCEHSDVNIWRKYLDEYETCIIHFKGGSFNNTDFVREMVERARQ